MLKLFAFLKRKRIKSTEKLESQRKEILKKLPKGSFAEKLYSQNNLNLEVALIKIGEHVFDISEKRKEKRTWFSLEKITDLSKTYDLTKATFCHTHRIKENIKERTSTDVSLSDFLASINLCHKFGVNKFEISILNKPLLEIGRIQFIFPQEFVQKIRSMNVKELDRFGKEIISSNDFNVMVNGNSSIITQLKRQNIMIKYVSLNGYKLEEVSDIPCISKIS